MYLLGVCARDSVYAHVCTVTGILVLTVLVPKKWSPEQYFFGKTGLRANIF